MSFEWQDRDAAARTLGVDTPTLQAWIDDGRAPSRTYQGRLQVLIEHIEETDSGSEATTSETKKGENSKGKTQDSHAEVPPRDEQVHGKPYTTEDDEDQSQGHERAQRVHAHASTTDLELVSKRELQLAGGMVAAWQRLAETSNQDLARARKVGALSWSLVAGLVIVSGVGLWMSTRSVTDAHGKLEATQEKLKGVERTSEETASRATALQLEVTQRTQDLADANSKLAATVERANLTKTQADAFAAQHLLTKQLADQQIETAKALAAALQSTIDEQKTRLGELEKELAAMTTKFATAEKQNAETAQQRDTLQKQIDTMTADQVKATTMIDDLKKQMTTMKTELDKLKKEPTSTAEKTGN